jgi:hypothetical protein
VSLDLKKLEKVRELANGVAQARCPACGESGGDRKGEHLRIYPDGRYGCCVYPRDAQHRKRIFALAGAWRSGATRGQFTVKVCGPGKPAEPARSVREVLAGSARTLRTGKSESVSSDKGSNGDFRTLRTLFFNPRAYARKGSDHTHIYKDSEKAVLSVLEGPPTIPHPVEEGERRPMPFITADGTLRIPFDSPERYHWWKPGGGRLTVKEIRAEVLAKVAR